jgi:hypothetical protein
MANLYSAVWAIPSYLVAVWGFGKLKRVLFFVLPFATGVLILLWFKLETGDYLTFLTLERAVWGVNLADPITQARWLLNVNGEGWFTGLPWHFFSISFTPDYWLIRNLIFEAFYFVGAFYLLKVGVPHRYFLFAFSLSTSVPILLFVGTFVTAIPRLFLSAFPVFYSYSSVLDKKHDWIYTLVCYGLAMGIMLVNTFSWFS